MIKKELLSKLSFKRKFNLIIKTYNKLVEYKKKHKIKYLDKFDYFNIVINKFKKINPKFITKKYRNKFLNLFKKKTKVKKKKLKRFYIKDNKFLTKRLIKLMKRFSNIKIYDNTKLRIKRRLKGMNRINPKKRMRINLRKKSYFFKILRKARRRKIKVVRLNRKKPIFTKKNKKEKKFLLKARDSLVKTKRFLYRKKFPKIKGKKNKNFNFFYYNNIEKVPFKFNIGRIVITYLLNNTFINIHSSKKMLKVISAGKLGFKGPKRSTPYSRQVVARKAINYVARTNLNVLDIFLNSNYNRWYYFLFKEISKPKIKPYVIRYLVISNSRAHGFIRDRKHRRK